MSAAKHTPGPWRVSKDGDTVVPESTNALLADVYDGSPSDKTDMEVTRANARLIAAAPEMLEASREIFLELDGRYDGAPDSRTLWMGEHLTRLRAAIAKAEGGGQ